MLKVQRMILLVREILYLIYNSLVVNECIMNLGVTVDTLRGYIETKETSRTVA